MSLRPDFSADCAALFPKIDALHFEFKQFDEYWVEHKQYNREISFATIEAGFDRKDGGLLQSLYGNGRQFGINVRFATASYQNPMETPDLKSYIVELDTRLEAIGDEKNYLQQLELIYEKYRSVRALFGISEWLTLHQNQVRMAERVLTVIVKELKRTDQYRNENNIQTSQNSNSMNQAPITNYGNLVLTMGDGNQVNVTITQGDRNALISKLRQSGLAELSATEFAEILDSERPNVTDSALTPTLNRAIYKLTEKAIDGTWSIPFGIAGSYLYDLIKGYCGL